MSGLFSKEDIPQLSMIAQVRELALNHGAISAVLMYGSFCKGEGDKYSDIEFYIFTRHAFNSLMWIQQIMPVLMWFRNEFDTEVVIFQNLVRGEFHFKPVEEANIILTWQGLTSFEYADNMLLVDKDTVLASFLARIDKNRPRHQSPEQILWLGQSLVNVLLQVKNLLAREEYAHAQCNFQYINKYLLWLVRLAAGADNHWESPTKYLEREVSANWYRAYAQSVPCLEAPSLVSCFGAALELADEVFQILNLPEPLKTLLKQIGSFKPGF